MTAAQDPPAPTPVPKLGLGPGGILVRVVVAIAFLLAGNLFIALISSVLGLIPALVEPGVPAVIAHVLLLACMTVFVAVAVWAWMRFVEHRRLRDAGWSWNATSIVWLLLGTAIAAGLTVAATALLPATGPMVAPTDGVPVAFNVAVVIATAFLLQGIPEELLFRGWLLTTLRARPILAITVSTLSFTVIHLISQGGQQTPIDYVLYLSVPFGFSLLGIGLILWTGSLWSAVGVHGGLHVGIAIAGSWLPPVDQMLSWLVLAGLFTALGLALIVAGLRRERHRPAIAAFS